MKKIIALTLTLIMVLALGVTAFAASMPLTAEYKVGETVNFSIDIVAGEKVTKVYDATGLITFGTPKAVDGRTDLWTVNGTLNAKGCTKIVVEYTDVNEDAQKYTSDVIEIVEAADAPQAGTDYLTFADLGLADETAFVDAYYGKTKIEFDLTGFDGISAEVYNATAKLNPVTITLYTDDYEVVLYCGDYTKLTLKKDVKINTMITSGPEWIYNNKNMNNQVLIALGNTSADPYYVSIDSTNLTELAENPKLTLKLNNESFDKWSKTNDCKAMDIYSFDPATNELTLVKENVSVNNLYDKWLEMPTIESAYYVLVNADDVVADSNNTTKPNVSTGGNAIASVFAIFALMGAAAVATKKIVK